MVFQSALNALNPVLRISSQVQDTARAHGERDAKKIAQRALTLFEMVRLDPDRVYNAYPHELSGGMRQRVLLALGLLLDPQVVILDEPTTALDVLTQRTIIEVLLRLKGEMGFALVFISHDLAMAAELADRMMTMYAGRAVELGAVEDVFYTPLHPYSVGLLRAVPALSGERGTLTSIPGSPPDLIAPPPGCKFAPRCPFRTEVCTETEPALEMHAVGHASACHHWEEMPVLRDIAGRESAGR
jgi:peptide/nickel transport system ATP-binding protein